MTDRDDYLWTGAGAPEPEVVELERVLARLRLRAPATKSALAGGPQSRPPSRWRARRGDAHRRRPWLALAAAAALIALGAAGWFWTRSPVPVPGAAVRLVVEGEDRALHESARLVADTERQLRLESFGEITLRAGSDLEVERLGLEQARLFLHRGEMEALVYANARPRFFQVGTPAARCVDLGCRYRLEVDERGDAEVEVYLGQVAFENEGREVYVPRGATCRASRAHGAGTPRFAADQDTAFGRALDRFDAASAEERRAVAATVIAQATEPRHALALWHFLQDRDPEVARPAVVALERSFGRPEHLAGAPGEVPSAADCAVWKLYLESRAFW